jgi:protein O-GlcNAc transferase
MIETMSTKQRVAEAFALQKAGQHKKAEAAYRAVIAVEPRNRMAHNNLGQVMLDLGAFAEAEKCFRTAIDILDTDPGVHVNLGVALLRQRRHAEAIVACEGALKIDPNFMGALNNLAGLLKDLGRFDEALAIYRRALGPNASPLANSNYLLTLHYGQHLTAQEMYAEHKAWEARHVPPPPAGGFTHANPREPERRLKIGYLSPDFHYHPVAYFIGAVLAAHDRKQFDIFCLSSAKRDDNMTKILKSIGHTWREVGFLDDEKLAEAIRVEGIDVLVDLTGHTAENRMLTMARKPAPVQMTYLGYPDTTGLSAVDYRITDVWADPPGESDKLASETLLRMRGGFVAYRPPADAPAVAALPALASGTVTFGSFNNLSKFSDQSLQLWSRVLRAVPNARFLLKSKVLDDPATREVMARRFVSQGIPPERLEIVGGSRTVTDVLAAYSRLDVALDPTPYNGTTTTCEAMWMGVPVVTLAGDRHSARVGASLLNAAGLGGLVAKDADSYVKIAAMLASKPTELAKLRADLRPRLSRSPLLDARRLTRELEGAYRAAWRKWCGAGAAG